MLLCVRVCREAVAGVSKAQGVDPTSHYWQRAAVGERDPPGQTPGLQQGYTVPSQSTPNMNIVWTRGFQNQRYEVKTLPEVKYTDTRCSSKKTWMLVAMTDSLWKHFRHFKTLSAQL